MKQFYCMEHHKHYPNRQKHLELEKHRCKLYNSQYDKLCHYTNCIRFSMIDGYCELHLGRVLQ